MYIAGIDLQDLHIFPFTGEISNGIEKDDFNLSHLIQPDVFLRVRPGQHETVRHKLTAAGIDFTFVDTDGIRVAAASKIDTALQVDREVVIQDHSSQRTGDLMKQIKTSHALHVWDCCAASGGKSILAKDVLGDIELTVSDIRPPVLEKLRVRLSSAGMTGVHVQTADLSKPQATVLENAYDLIITDAPCTGSGTWGRTPERLQFFNKKELERYTQLQQQIVQNSLPCLKKGGYFLYITCSVFKKENEDIVAFIKSHGATLQEMKLLKGYDHRADSMFAALFEKY